MKKILILSDSNANPRVSPVVDKIELEETYPYILRSAFPDATFYQLSFGNITTEQLVNQAISYLLDWQPDVIIVHSGICDCRPEAFSDFQKEIISNLTGRISIYLRKLLNKPSFIKRRKVFRVSPQRFRKTLKKFKKLFPESAIYWVDISVAPEYEKTRPGVLGRIIQYNKILEEIYAEQLLNTTVELSGNDAYCSDHLHINKNGHKIIAEMLISRLKQQD